MRWNRSIVPGLKITGWCFLTMQFVWPLLAIALLGDELDERFGLPYVILGALAPVILAVFVFVIATALSAGPDSGETSTLRWLAR